MAKEQRDNPDDDPDEAIQDASKQAPRLPGKRPPERDPGDEDRRPRRPRDSEDDDRPRRRPPRRDRRDDGGAISSLIPYRNGLALGAYYCGVFALIPFVGVVLGIISIILGIMGLNYAKREPAAKGAGHAIAGIVLGAIVLLAHLGFAIFVFVIKAAPPR